MGVLISNRTLDNSSNSNSTITSAYIHSVGEDASGNAVFNKINPDGSMSVDLVNITKSKLDPYMEYNEGIDRVISNKAIQTTLNSLHLKEQLTLSSGFSDLCVRDHTTDFLMTIPFSGMKGSLIANDASAEISCIKPQARIFSDRIEVNRYGDPLESQDAVKEVNEEVFIDFCMSACGIEFIFGENITEDVKLVYQNSTEGRIIFEQILPKQNYFKNLKYQLSFDTPMNICVDMSGGEILNFQSKIIKCRRSDDEFIGYLLARIANSTDPITGSTKLYIKLFARPFVDKEIAFKDDLIYDISGNLEERVANLENHHQFHEVELIEDRVTAIESKMTKPNGELIDLEHQRQRTNTLEAQVLELQNKLNSLMPE